MTAWATRGSELIGGDAAGALVVAALVAREGWGSLRAIETTERIHR